MQTNSLKTIQLLLKSAALPLLVSFITLAILTLFGVREFIPVLLIMIDINIIFSYLIKKKEYRPKLIELLKSVVQSIIFISIIYWLFYLCYLVIGLYGFFLASFLLLAYTFWGTKEHRQSYMNGVRLAEENIFGKSLDKDNWNGKKPKLKIVWKKKGDKNEIHN